MVNKNAFPGKNQVTDDDEDEVSHSQERGPSVNKRQDDFKTPRKGHEKTGFNFGGIAKTAMAAVSLAGLVDNVSNLARLKDPANKPEAADLVKGRRERKEEESSRKAAINSLAKQYNKGSSR